MYDYKKRWKYSFSEFLNDVWTHIYGLITVISFIVALIFSIITIKQPNGPDFKEVLYILTGLVLLLAFIIIRISAKYSKLHTISADLLRYERDNDSLYILIQQQAETFHNITHYHRNLIFSLDDYILNFVINKNEFSKDKTSHILERNDNFLILFTTALQNYFSIYTDDNCAITLKLLSDDKQYVKTLFRDPVNLKKRRQSEHTYLNGFYSINDNTAFEIIADENYTNIYFASDDLRELYQNYNYKNINPSWFNSYNATVVVPISKINSQTERHIVGFITVDNLKGGLADNQVLEFLFSIADLLYNYFVKMNQFVTFAHLNNFRNEKTERYLFGSNS